MAIKPVATRGALMAERIAKKRADADALAGAGQDGEVRTTSPQSVPGHVRSASILSGKTEVLALHRIDPALCRSSKENARDYANLTEENCRDLIDALLSEGGQRIPAVVRRTGEEAQPYEVVAGSRRHFAISWLRANNYPDFEYVVQIEDIQDEQAFRLSDVENRARKDVSAWERGVSYQRALATYYNSNVQEMADRLRMSSRNLRYLLDIARLPQSILDAFASPRELTVTNSSVLIKHFKEGQGTQAAILEEALIIAEHQRQLLAAERPKIPTANVIKRLVAAREKRAESDKRAKQGYVVANGNGKTLLTWSPPRGRGGLSLLIPNDKSIDPIELKRAFADIVDAHFDKTGLPEMTEKPV